MGCADMVPTQTKSNTTKILIILIAVLAVALAAVLIAAVGMSGNPGNTDNTEAGSTPSTSVTTEPPVSYPEELTILSPSETEFLTLDSALTITGTSDPRVALAVNGTAVSREEDGSFSYDVALTVGSNTITVVYGDQTLTYTVEHRYLVQSFAPAEAQSYNSGATVYFSVAARSDSTVTADFNGKTITLKEDSTQAGVDLPEGFTVYTGEYKLPDNNVSDKDMGAITYTAVLDDRTETYTSGTITCLKPADILSSDPGATPDYGDYIDVGSGYIAEIITLTGETFDGDKVDDFSHPTNNYLPKGTVDYCSVKEVKLGELSYVVLRSGQRLYIDKKNNPTANIVRVVDRYKGTLPDHNELTFVSMTDEGQHTVLTLESLWKAPFYFDLKPQTYQHPASSIDRNYSVKAFTAEYVDITFCYTPGAKFTGTVTIPEGNQIFKSAELISREEDCVLRLHLKEKGSFYGWDAYYDDQDRLCFRFLNPAKVTASDNALGADLTGVKVLIDVGHGGKDPGKVRENYKGQDVHEAERNLSLALKLRADLEAAGATVVMTRTTDITLTVDERIRILKQEKPDICVSVHHNSIEGFPNFGGFEAFYYTPFSKTATDFVNTRTDETGIYSRAEVNWHVFFMARQTLCPVVLTENGYMSCNADLDVVIDESVMEAKALAIAKGIADYFLSLNK